MYKLYFLGLLIFSSVLKATPPEQELSNILNSMTSLRADFSQKLLDHNNNVLQESNGKMTILKPGRFKWEILNPEEILIIVEHNKVLNFDKTLEQVTIQNSKSSSGLPISDLLAGKEDISKSFIVKTSVQCDNVSPCFTIESKSEQADFSKALLGFQDKKLVFFQVWDNLGQNSVFNFRNVKLNTSVKDQEFKFKIPPNVDVIKSE